jgi:hypothetical protein
LVPAAFRSQALAAHLTERHLPRTADNAHTTGDDAASEVLFHLDTVEFQGQQEVVRVVMFMKQSRNLHVFHMPDLLKPPVHRVVPLAKVFLLSLFCLGSNLV